MSNLEIPDEPFRSGNYRMFIGGPLLKMCMNCEQKEDFPNITLKACGSCKVIGYCSKACQKADWPDHKLICPRITVANEENLPADIPDDPNDQHDLEFHAINAMLGLTDNNCLHKLSQKEAMNQLIDAFRLRLANEDREGTGSRGVYSASKDSRSEFKELLDLVETREGILPPWWNK